MSRWTQRPLRWACLQCDKALTLQVGLAAAQGELSQASDLDRNLSLLARKPGQGQAARESYEQRNSPSEKERGRRVPAPGALTSAHGGGLLTRRSGSRRLHEPLEPLNRVRRRPTRGPPSPTLNGARGALCVLGSWANVPTRYDSCWRPPYGSSRASLVITHTLKENPPGTRFRQPRSVHNPLKSRV